MTTTNSIKIVSPSTGNIVPERTTVEIKLSDKSLRHNLQLFVYAADGKFYPQHVPVYDKVRDLYTVNCHIGFTPPNTDAYTLLAVSSKRVWNVDAVLDDDTFGSVPVIVKRA